MTERNRDFMTCEIIKDLLPLYADGICSEESAAQIKEHLEECEECRRKLEHYQASIAQKDTQDAKVDDTLRPMKKVKRKLRRHKWLSVTLGIFLTILLAGLGVLTVGEINGHVISFTTCTNIIRLNYITNQLTKGNTDALLDVLCFRLEDRYAVNGASNYDGMAEYKVQLKKQMDEAYAYYFEGKNITVRLSEVYTYQDANFGEEETYFLMAENGYCYDFYDGETLVLSMCFNSRDGKYSVQEMGKENVYLEQSPSFVLGTLPSDELIKDVVRYASKNRYRRFAEEGHENENTPLTFLLRKFEGEMDENESYGKTLRERTAALYQEGWALKDFMYSVDFYDEELGRWIYKMWFVFENPETGESCMTERCFVSYDCLLYVVKEKPAVILNCTDSVSEEIQEKILHYFD